MSTLIRKIAGSVSTTIAIQFLALIGGVMVARLLGPESRGGLAAAFAFFAAISSTLGVGLADSPAFLATQRNYRRSEILSTSLLIAVGLAFPATLVCYFLMGIFPGATEDLRLSQLILTGYPIWQYLSLVVVGVAQGGNASFAWNTSRALVTLVYVVLVFLFAVTGTASCSTVTASMLMGTAAAALSGLILLRRKEYTFGAPRASLAVHFMSYGVKAHLIRLSTVARDQGDKLILSALVSPSELGLYVVAATVSQPGLVISQTFSAIFFPRLAAAHEKGSQKELAFFWITTVIGSCLFTVVAVPLSAILVPLMFGGEFARAARIAQYFIVFTSIAAVRSVITVYLNARGKPLDASVGEIVSVISSLALMLVLVPLGGIEGAGVACVVGQCLGTALSLMRLGRVLGKSQSAIIWLTRFGWCEMLRRWALVRE